MTPGTLPVEETAKAIKDLDHIVRGLLVSLRGSKPWHRQLSLHLMDADRLLQVLRMTVAMDCPLAEVQRAARDLVIPLNAAQTYAASSRADCVTRRAIQLGIALARRVAALLEKDQHSHASSSEEHADRVAGRSTRRQVVVRWRAEASALPTLLFCRSRSEGARRRRLMVPIDLLWRLL